MASYRLAWQLSKRLHGVMQLVPSQSRSAPAGQHLSHFRYLRPPLEAPQGFNWESCKQQWWEHMAGQADFIASCGFTVVWLPPPTDSVSREGYM